MEGLSVFDVVHVEQKARADERERIASILERELYENSDPTRSAAERAYRKAHNDRTLNIVRRLRGEGSGGDSLCG